MDHEVFKILNFKIFQGKYMHKISYVLSVDKLS